MFHSFYVTPEDRDFLRFLWFKDNDPLEKIVEYRMAVHLFGNVSSPSIATFGLRKTADEEEMEFGSVAKNFCIMIFTLMMGSLKGSNYICESYTSYVSYRRLPSASQDRLQFRRCDGSIAYRRSRKECSRFGFPPRQSPIPAVIRSSVGSKKRFVYLLRSPTLGKIL